MKTPRPIRARGPGRAAPRRAAPRWALAVLSLAALAFDGCASLGLGGGNGLGLGACGGGCGKPGGCGLAKCGFGRKLFHRDRAIVAADGCDAGLGVPAMEGAPLGPIAPGQVIPAPPADADPQIDALPSGGATGTTPGGSANGGSGRGLGARSATSKAFYQAEISGPRGESRREVASRPSGRGGSGVAPSADDAMADVLKLTVPAEATPEGSPPASSTAGDPPASAPSPSPATSPASPEAGGVSAPSPAPAPEKDNETSKTGASAELPPKPAEAIASLAPGIRRFVVIEPGVAAGSLPTDRGWAWLVQSGYKTVLDLRAPRRSSNPSWRRSTTTAFATSPSVARPRRSTPPESSGSARS